jgi:hypothetical protein
MTRDADAERAPVVVPGHRNADPVGALAAG